MYKLDKNAVEFRYAIILYYYFHNIFQILSSWYVQDNDSLDDFQDLEILLNIQ